MAVEHASSEKQQETSHSYSGVILPYFSGACKAMPFATSLTKMGYRLDSLLLLGLLFTSLTGCGSGSGKPAISTTVTPTGAIASLAWDSDLDPSVFAYYVHYGKRSSGQTGSCNYEDSKYVTSSNTTITGLDANSLYYFSVSAYNGLSGPCSDEISTVTPRPQT